MNFRGLEAEREQAMKIAFEEESRKRGYTTDRGLATDGNSAFPMGGYREALPFFKAGDVMHQINQKVKELGNSRRVDILDVGCGTGRFLVDCAQKWPSKIRPVGITAHRYYTASEYGGGTYDISGYLDKYGVEITVGDAQKLTDYFTKNQFDFATAVQVTRYTADPWAVVKGMYDVLRVGGTGLVFPFDPNFMGEGATVLQDYLKKQLKWHIPAAGSRWELAFEKTSENLDLPLEIDEVRHNRVFYKLKRNNI